MTIREGRYERFFFPAVFFPIGLGFMFSGKPDLFGAIVGFLMTAPAFYSTVRGLFFSPTTKIDLEYGKILHHQFRRTFLRETRIIPRGMIYRIRIENEISREGGKHVYLELKTGDRIDLPEGCHRQLRKIYKAFTELEGRSIPCIESRI